MKNLNSADTNTANVPPPEYRVIAETHANQKFIILSFFTAPLWLSLVELRRVRGYSFLETLLITFQTVITDPLYLTFLAIVELIIVISFFRTKNQKLRLTDKSLLLQTGVFKPVTESLPLTEIKSLYIRKHKSVWGKKTDVATIIIETLAGDKKSFGVMQNAKAFTDKANYHIAMLKKNTTEKET